MEKSYKEALERAREIYNAPAATVVVRTWLEQIFPEIEESEDEKMRKELIDFIEKNSATPFTLYSRFTPEQYIVYLEKLKEQKPAEGDNETEIQKAFREGKSAGRKEVFDHPEEYGLQKEQKPAINIEHIKSYMLQYLQDAASRKDDVEIEADTDKWARMVIKVFGGIEQQPAEWSEEDEERIRQNGRLDVCYNPEKYGLCHKTEWGEEEMKVLVSIIDDYEMAAKSFCGHDGKIMLLKAIRDGKYDLSKREWSDEDKKILYEIIRNVSAYDAYTGTTYQQPERHDKKINFLRTLHPSWKPSEEQIKALEDVKMRMSLEGYGLCPLLQTLIDDLKSL